MSSTQIDPADSQEEAVAARFRALLGEARNGSEEAVRQIVRLCSPAVLRAVRTRLREKFRRVVDSEDLTQAVWASVWVGKLREREFADYDEFVRLLVRVATHKVVDHCERRRGAQRVGRLREVRLDSETAANTPARGVTPSRIVGAREDLSQLLRNTSDRHRTIVKLHAEGVPYTEIARRFEMNPGSVRRIVHQFLARLKERGAQPQS